MAAGDGAADPEALAKGVALVHRELREALERVGLTAFDPAGERFDPAWHEAISTRARGGPRARHRHRDPRARLPARRASCCARRGWW